MKWHKSSFSSTGATCVQVRPLGEDLIEIGDTKDPNGPTLTVPTTDWSYFLHQIAHNLSGYRRLRPSFLSDGGFTLTDTATPNSPTLTYTKAECDAFRLGAQAGELRGADPRGVLVS